jgi:anti-sigma B factor antagonist
MTTSVSDSIATTVDVVTHTTVTVRVAGRLDAARCPELRAEIDARIAAHCDALCVDLHDTAFIDSVGLAALVKAMRDADSIGSEFWLVRPATDDAMRVFRLSKFDSVFDMRSRT